MTIKTAAGYAVATPVATAVTKAVARSELATATAMCRHTATAITLRYGAKGGVAAAAKAGVATAAVAEVAVANVVVAKAVVAKLPATLPITTQRHRRHPLFHLPTRREVGFRPPKKPCLPQISLQRIAS